MSWIPFKYHFKSLFRRPMRSLMTAAGIALSIFLSVVMIGLSRGLLATKLNTGNPLNVLVISYGATSPEFSSIDPDTLHLMNSIQGIESNSGVQLMFPELLINATVGCSDPKHRPLPVLVRGLRPEGHRVYNDVKVSKGRLPEKGYEIAVGPLVETRLGHAHNSLKVGEIFSFEGHDWKVCGLLDAGGTAYESEIWAPLEELRVVSKRPEYSDVIIRAKDEACLEEIMFDLKTRTDIRTTAFRETDYYAADTDSLKPFTQAALFTTIMLVFGGFLAGMNTMFSNVCGRLYEISLLMVIGYKRKSILTGFVLEGILLSIAGGIAGCLAGLYVNGIPMNFIMVAFRFRIDAVTLSAGMGMALLIGFTGSVIPIMLSAGSQTIEEMRRNSQN